MNNKKLKIVVCGLLIVISAGLILCCKHFFIDQNSYEADTNVPANQIVEFRSEVFENPKDPKGDYTALEYNGRTYIMFGTQGGRINRSDIGDYLGYYVQDGEKMEDVKIYRLNSDPDTNYLMRSSEGFMEQPDFFRAIDTVDKDIDTPEYIEDLGYDFWK